METGLTIANKQNEPEQLAKQAAKNNLYLRVNIICAFQIVLALLMALVGVLIKSYASDKAEWVEIFAAGLALLDILALENLKLHDQTLAAQIQESFDCDVLDLSWRKLKASNKPGPELIAKTAKGFIKSKNIDHKNWYPPSVSQLPLAAARILCQRQNCLYSKDLRERYMTLVIWCLIIVTLLALSAAFWVNPRFETALANIIVPLIPWYIVCFREYNQNKEAVETVNRLYEHAEELWKDVLEKSKEAIDKNPSLNAINRDSRFLQDEIYDSRRRSPVIFSWLYEKLRDENEPLFSTAFDEKVAEYVKAHAAK